MPVPTITALPTPPDRGMSGDAFANAADTFVDALPTFRTELNAFGVALEAVATEIVNTAFTATSSTSRLIGTGSKTFTLDTDAAFIGGHRVQITSRANAANYMRANVDSYNATTNLLTVTVDEIGGAGTFADWDIALTAAFSSAGLVDTTTAQTVGGLKTFSAGIIINAQTLDGLTLAGVTLAEAADAAAQRTALGLVIGANVQAYDPDLTTWAGITPGTGVGAALGVNVGSAGAVVLFNGAGGTPTSLTLTNATGLPVAGITSSTTTALGLGSIELGHASDTTLTRVSAGVIAVEGVNLVRAVTAITSGLTMATARLLGRTTAAAGAIEEISIGAGLTLSAGVLNTAASGLPAWTQIGNYSPSGTTNVTVTVGSYKEFLFVLSNCSHNNGTPRNLSIGIAGSDRLSNLSDVVADTIAVGGIMHVVFRNPAAGYDGYCLSSVKEFPAGMAYSYSAQGGSAFTTFDLHWTVGLWDGSSSVIVYGR